MRRKIFETQNSEYILRLTNEKSESQQNKFNT